MSEQFWLDLFDLCKPPFQHLGNLLVILLPCALEQRLIRRILNQGMLEEVAGVRRQAALVEQLGLDQLSQPLL